MNYTFFKYFLFYIFKAKTRQRLLFIAIFGLMLSALSLVVIQGVMSGLQDGLVSRSKRIMGVGYFDSQKMESQKLNEYIKILDQSAIQYSKELRLEILLKNNTYLSPTIINGIDTSSWIPEYLEGKVDHGIVLAADLYGELNTFLDSDIKLISPTHYDYIFGEIPRSVSSNVSSIVVSEIPEIDKTHSWVDIKILQNLIRERKINRLRFFSMNSFKKAQELLPKNLFVPWETVNQSLVWALNLETSVMIFLFVSMSLLVSICITSGYMIFFDKIKNDLLSFWVLGMSKERLSRLSLIFIQLISFFTSVFGLILGLGLLKFISSNKVSFLGDLFIEQTIPVKITSFSMAISFLIPFLISSIFSYLAYLYFQKENRSFLAQIRKLI